MRTFELTSPQVSISLRFPMQKRVLAYSRRGLFNFRFLFTPANCLANYRFSGRLFTFFIVYKKKVYAVVKKPMLVIPFVMLKNVGQNIILLIIYQNQLNILLITKNFPFCGVFYLLLQKMIEHVQT